MGLFARRFKSMFASQKKVWQQLARNQNAELFKPGIFKPYLVLKKTAEYEIRLNSFTKMVGKTPIVTTRFVLNFPEESDFRFVVKRKHLLNKRAPKGLEPIVSEFENFDRLFRLFASNKRKANHVFTRNLLSEIADQIPYNDLQIEGEDKKIELHIRPLVKDLEQLNSLFELLDHIYHQLIAEF
ncbi:MAG: hypothetical protein JW729_10775 [Bacteroidales bacterium]|nr:hypothetical protein [Bacteroidales bacterium]